MENTMLVLVATVCAPLTVLGLIAVDGYHKAIIAPLVVELVIGAVLVSVVLATEGPDLEAT